MNKEQEKVLEDINKAFVINKKNSLDMAHIEINKILNNNEKIKDALKNKINSTTKEDEKYE